jgi:hypothetical protein
MTVQASCYKHATPGGVGMWSGGLSSRAAVSESLALGERRWAIGNGGGEKGQNIEHQTLNIEHQTLNIEHQTLNIEHQT